MKIRPSDHSFVFVKIISYCILILVVILDVSYNVCGNMVFYDDKFQYLSEF